MPAALNGGMEPSSIRFGRFLKATCCSTLYRIYDPVKNFGGIVAKFSGSSPHEAVQPLYKYNFITNVLRLLDERGMTKLQLSKKSGVSPSFLSTLTLGKGNPSLKVMEAIAAALETPLSLILEHTDLDRKAQDALTGGKTRHGLPDGYEVVVAVLSEFRAFQVKLWAEETRKKLEARTPEEAGKVRRDFDGSR